MAGKKHVQLTAKDIRAPVARRASRAAGAARQRRYAATTEDDIRRHMREDGYDPDHTSPADVRLTVPVKLVREKLDMTQAELAILLRVPLGTQQLGAEPFQHRSGSPGAAAGALS